MSQHALTSELPDEAPDRPPHLAHHFMDLAQQKESATLGMWLFLATEVMLFGAIFTSYVVYRHTYYPGFSEGSGHLYVSLGGPNTLVLLASSFAMAMAVHAGHDGNSKKIVLYLLITIVLGAIFIAIKLTEYYIDAREGLVPLDGWWRFKASDPSLTASVRLFFVFYFLMTLLHALHMTVGMLLLSLLAYLAHKRKFSAEYYTPVEIMGLYWHFVDIVWVFLFPTLYLIHPELHLLK